MYKMEKSAEDTNLFRDKRDPEGEQGKRTNVRNVTSFKYNVAS